MNTAILLYDGFTALDAIGPYEVLSRIPARARRSWRPSAGPVRTDNGMLSLVADRSLEEVPAPEIVLVPGGPGEVAARAGGPALEWLRAAHETSTWTTSVCTGSLILAAAGLLDGKRATSHWLALDTLAELGAEAVAERVVFDGKIVTAAGVSAGIDMALALAREDRRRAGRAGDPARHRVRPAAAVRRGLAGQGAGGDRRSCCATRAAWSAASDALAPTPVERRVARRGRGAGRPLICDLRWQSTYTTRTRSSRAGRRCGRASARGR